MTKKKSTNSRQKWTEEEEEELHILFTENFTTGKCPNEKVCRSAMEKSKNKGGAIYEAKRTNWETVKKKVYRMIQDKDKE